MKYINENKTNSNNSTIYSNLFCSTNSSSQLSMNKFILFAFLVSMMVVVCLAEDEATAIPPLPVYESSIAPTPEYPKPEPHGILGFLTKLFHFFKEILAYVFGNF